MRIKLRFYFLFLTTLSLLMVYSASQIWASYKNGSEIYYFIRQIIFYLLGITLYLLIRKIDSSFYEKHKNTLLIISIFLLIIVLIPPIGIVRGGARSWINLGFFAFQPSEFVKLSLIIFTASYLKNNKDSMQKLSSLILIVLLVLLIFGLIMLEPDFGTGFILTLTILSMILLSGIKKSFFYIGIIMAISGIIFLIIIAPYRLQRIFAYLNPWSDPLGSGFQIIQSLYALCPSGIFGTGLFKSRQKYFYLPEPQTDFIFSIIVEELGMIGGVVVILIFFGLFYECIIISLKSKDLFESYLAIGITLSIFIQFFINIGVVIGLLPVTGVTLPFLSYGGSSLVMNFIMMGIMDNLAKKNDYDN